MIRLKIVSDEQTQVQEFSAPMITIGSDAENHLRLADSGVSDQHAVIERTDNGFRIRDLDSRLGTFVDHNRVDSALLAAGDLIEIGEAVIYVEAVPPALTSHLDTPTASTQKEGDAPTVIDPAEAAVVEVEVEVDAEAEPETVERSVDATLEQAHGIANAISDRCRAEVRGRDDVIELVVIALLAGGHVLLEDYPGSGKTTLAKALGNSLIKTSSDAAIRTFRRIQFTPDLMPSDVTGVTFFDAKNHNFVFRPGPVFANIVLADEINRASPKVQAALLEAMAEKQVTVDDETHPLEDLFCVIATQNPLDTGGTYPLPSPQLDRFLFKIRMQHLSPEHELEVLSQLGHVDTSSMARVPVQELIDVRSAVLAEVRVDRLIHELLVQIAGALRVDKRVAQGISTRALVLAISALQMRAMMHDRNYVVPEDVRALLIPLFAHRLVLKPGTHNAEDVVTECARGPLEAAAKKTLSRYFSNS